MQNFNEPTEKMDDKENSDGNKIDNQYDDQKGPISVTESNEIDCDKKSALKMLIVKAKQKSYKQRFIRRLMLYGLKPSLRVASMKTVFCKKKISVVNIRKKIEGTRRPVPSVINHTGIFSTSGKNPTVVSYELKIHACLRNVSIIFRMFVLFVPEVYSDEKTGVKCPICSTTINDSLLLEQHLALSHAKDVTYKCGICTFVCQYHGDYLTHMKNHFPGPPYKCDYCTYVGKNMLDSFLCLGSIRYRLDFDSIGNEFSRIKITLFNFA